MGDIKRELTKRQDDLERLLKKLNYACKKAPRGKLRINSKRGKVQYYIRNTPSERTGTYVRKEDLPLAAAIAQRDYDELLKEVAERELKAIRQLRAAWDAGTPEDTYDSLTPARRSLVTPRIMTDEEYAARWLAEPYIPKSFKEGYPIYQSAKGQRVRSKSEALILDVYDSYGIPVKYECPLTLRNGMIIHPDFTALNVARRKTFIHEHLGLADDPQYMARNVARMNELILNGWIPGVNMMLTFETREAPLEVDVLRTLIEACLL